VFFSFLEAFIFAARRHSTQVHVFIQNQLPRETHYRKICRFTMDLFWFKKTVLWALPVVSKIQVTQMIKILYLCAFREEHSLEQNVSKISK